MRFAILAFVPASILMPGLALADCPVSISGRSISIAVPRDGSCSQTFGSSGIVGQKMLRQPLHGRAGLSSGSNGFAYQAKPGFTGDDAFSYEVTCTCGPNKALQKNIWSVSVQVR